MHHTEEDRIESDTAPIQDAHFSGRREPAWFGLGTSFKRDDKIKASDAAEPAGIDHGIVKIQNEVRNPRTSELMPVDSYAVMRTPTRDDDDYKYLGTVGERWTHIPIEDLTKMLDPISEKYPVQCAGTLSAGKKIFIVLDAGDSEIAGEDHSLYYLVTDHRDGGGSLTMAFTPVRMACGNTLVTALSQAKISVNLRHDVNIKREAEWYMGLFSQMTESREATVEVMNEMAKTSIDEPMRIIDKSYPKIKIRNKARTLNNVMQQYRSAVDADNMDPVVAGMLLEQHNQLQENRDREIANRQSHMDSALERYEIFNDEHSRLAGSAWALYNAIVENEDYRRGNIRRDGNQSPSSSLYGDRAKIKVSAFNALMEV